MTARIISSIDFVANEIVVHLLSALDGSPCEETIHVREVVQVALERVRDAHGDDVLHWYLRHREGWTLRFNNAFTGAEVVSLKLQAIFQFA